MIWWVVSQKTSSSTNSLMDFMGFGSYEMAWSWLQKLRRAMVLPDKDKLSGEVEVDETYIRRKEIVSNKQGRGSKTKTLVVVATCIGKQIGRVRFKCIPDASGEYFLEFIEENCSTGSRNRLCIGLLNLLKN